MTVEKLLTHPLAAQITPQQLSVFDSVMTTPIAIAQTRTRNHSGGSTGSYGSSGSSSGYGSDRITPLSPELIFQLSKLQNGMAHLSQQNQQNQLQQKQQQQLQQQQHQQQQQQQLQQQQQQQQQQQSRHKRTERPLNASGDRTNPSQAGVHKNINPTRYKTEMCRPFEESGYCKYGEKCQFAHGCHELRTLSRHPKYKTELCRTYHTVGFCPYGPRCHFIHNEDEVKLSEITQMKQQQALKQVAEQVAAAQQQQVLSQLSSSTQVLNSNSSNGGGHHQQHLHAGKPEVGVLLATSQTRPRPLDFAVPLSLGSTIDTPPSSVTHSPPSMSPTSMMSDDVTPTLAVLAGGLSTPPPPPPGFGTAPALSGVFNFPDVAKPVVGLPMATSGLPLATSGQPMSTSGLSMTTSGLSMPTSGTSPLSVNVANLAAGLQAATIGGASCAGTVGADDVIKDCLGDLLSAPLTPPMSGDEPTTLDSPTGNALLRLPIFSQLAIGIN